MIRVTGLQYTIGHFSMDISFAIGADEYMVLLGMTGSGKTILLECLAGLRAVTGGQVMIREHDMTYAPPRNRGIGYVPQDGALFGHLRVRDNIGFALSVRGLSRGQCKPEVEAIAATLGITHLLERPIAGLSGGERQRVALARALVAQPAVLLLDEPVSALDEFTRDAVCDELVRVQERLHIPVIHVCHSSEEARRVADFIGIMESGRMIQTGPLEAVMAAPASPYVQRLLRLKTGSG